MAEAAQSPVRGRQLASADSELFHELTNILLGFENGQILILGSREQVVRQVQERMKSYGDPARLWSEELSAERREEAGRE